MATDLRRRLRTATASDHQRLEDSLDILARVASLAGRRELVAAFLCLHVSAEAAMAPHLAAVEGLDFEARRRSARLLADLEVLGGRPRQAARANGCDSLGAALGWLYVLEGSTLGGKLIQARLAARGEGMQGLSFLDPYGPESGVRWRTFLDVLEREGADPAAAKAAEAGALAGFRQAHDLLCGAEAGA